MTHAYHISFIGIKAHSFSAANVQLKTTRRNQVPTEKTLPSSGFEPETFRFLISALLPTELPILFLKETDKICRNSLQKWNLQYGITPTFFYPKSESSGVFSLNP
jgi:hypothetical protein